MLYLCLQFEMEKGPILGIPVYNLNGFQWCAFNTTKGEL